MTGVFESWRESTNRWSKEIGGEDPNLASRIIGEAGPLLDAFSYVIPYVSRAIPESLLNQGVYRNKNSNTYYDSDGNPQLKDIEDVGSVSENRIQRNFKNRKIFNKKFMTTNVTVIENKAPKKPKKKTKRQKHAIYQ